MVHSKTKIILSSILIFYSMNLFAQENLSIHTKLIKMNNKQIVFDVFITNDSMNTKYFFPHGISEKYKLEDNEIVIEFNNDGEYGNGLISAQEPFWKKRKGIILIPNKKIKYRYSIKINKYLESIGKENIEIKKLVFTITVGNISLAEINSFNEYLEYMKSKDIYKERFILEKN